MRVTAGGPAPDIVKALRGSNLCYIRGRLTIGQVLGEYANIGVTAGDHHCRQLGPPETVEARKAGVNYPHLDTLPAVPGLVPSLGAMHRRAVPDNLLHGLGGLGRTISRTRATPGCCDSCPSKVTGT